MDAVRKLRPGATAVRVGDCVLGYRYARERRPVERLTPIRGRMLRRCAEIARLGQFRAAYDPVAEVEHRNWAKIIADILSFEDSRLTLEDFRRVARDADLEIDDATANAALDQAAARHRRYGVETRPIRGDRAGSQLGMTCEARLACGIVTMAAIDETPAERRARVAEARRERDRLRKRQERAARPRQPRRPTQEQARPWAALGMARATWFRRGRPASPPAESGETKTRPPTQSVDMGADAGLSHVAAVPERGAPEARLPAMSERIGAESETDTPMRDRRPPASLPAARPRPAAAMAARRVPAGLPPLAEVEAEIVRLDTAIAAGKAWAEKRWRARRLRDQIIAAQRIVEGREQ